MHQLALENPTPFEVHSLQACRDHGAWLRGLKFRDLRPELLDLPGVSQDSHDAALLGLERVNIVSRTGAVVWKALRHVAQDLDRPISILELASGGGDMAVDVVRRAELAGIPVEYTGLDFSESAVALARRRATAIVRIANSRMEFLKEDVFAWKPERRYDVVVCSLFLHHLSFSSATELLRRMAALSRRLVVVNDLVRGRWGYWAAKIVCPLVSRSEIVRCDGPQSVAAAFRLDEVRRIASEAGLHDATVRHVWPFRFQLTWEPCA
jgi:2-polyprenyl-3-methyl-5-hydroxy-6-metoxy-1,4-benzoquinol methylase